MIKKILAPSLSTLIVLTPCLRPCELLAQQASAAAQAGQGLGNVPPLAVPMGPALSQTQASPLALTVGVASLLPSVSKVQATASMTPQQALSPSHVPNVFRSDTVPYRIRGAGQAVLPLEQKAEPRQAPSLPPSAVQPREAAEQRQPASLPTVGAHSRPASKGSPAASPEAETHSKEMPALSTLRQMGLPSSIKKMGAAASFEEASQAAGGGFESGAGGAQAPSVAARDPLPESKLVEPVLSESLKEELRVVEREMGAVVKRGEAPHLYGLADKVFRRIADAQEKLIGKTYVPINNIFILSAPFANAFVYTPRSTGVRVSSNLVFVTTAMLRKLFDPDGDLAQGAHRLAGILAHELAHPLDRLVIYDHGEYLSIEKEYGQRGSQAQEVRADIEGTALLRAADLPERALFDAMERTLDVYKASNVLEAAIGSHPEDSMRMTILRMALTLTRLRLGDNHSVRPFRADEFNGPGVSRDLKAVGAGAGALPWRSPKDLSATLSRLKMNSSLPEEQQVLEFNRLILALDAQLAELQKSKTEVSPEQKRELIDTFKFLFKKGIVQEVWDAQKRGKALSPYADSAELLKLPVHSKSLSTIWFYYDSEYTAEMFRVVDEPKIPEKVAKLQDFIPPMVLADKYGPAFADAEAQRASVQDPTPRSSVIDIRSLALLRKLLPEFQERLAKAVGEDRLMAMTQGSAAAALAMPFFLKSDASYETLTKENRKMTRMIRELRILAKGNLAEPVGIWEGLQKYARWFWERRGFFAVQELLMDAGSDYNHRSINWDLVAEILDLDKTQLRNQISQEVDKLLRSEEEREADWRRQRKEADAGKKKALPVFTTFFARLGSMISGTKYPPVKRLYAQKFIDPWAEETKHPMPVWYRPEHGKRILAARSRATGGDAYVGSITLALTIMANDASLRNEVYRASMLEEFDSPRHEEWTPEHIAGRLLQLEKKFGQYWAVNAKASSHNAEEGHLSVLELAKAVDRSAGLSKEEKILLLRFIFLRGKEFTEEQNELVNKAFYRWTQLRKESVQEISGILIKNGAASSLSDLVSQLRASPYYPPLAKVAYERDNGVYSLSDYFDFLDNVSPQLLREEGDARRIAALLTVPLGLKADRAHSNTPNIQELRDSLTQRMPETLSSFLTLTQTGASKGTDEWFKEKILPALGKRRGDLTWVKGVLIKDRIQSHDLRLKLAKWVLESRIAKLEAAPSFTKEEVFALVSDLNLMAPQGSLAKDKFIEQLSWRLKLAGANLFAFIEDQKTSNWKRENPLLVNAGSVIASGIHRMSAERRKLFLEYLMDPRASKSGLPEEVLQELFQQALDKLIQESEGRRRKRDTNRAVLEDKARGIARALKLQIELYLRDSAPTERIPLIEVVLTAGNQALMTRPDYPSNLVQGFLKYEPGSVEESLLLSYLSIIPAHEIAPSLAYLLSQAAQDKGTVASLFEVFGTVGIKFGQLASIWQLFGPKIAAETRHLKDRAPPMSRYEIYDRMDALMTSEEREKIVGLEKIMGSASVKTVVRTPLKDGRKVVMVLQPGPISNQIQTNLELGRRFLDELERRDLVKQSRMLATLIEALRGQLVEEIDFSLEAKRTDRARRVLGRYNRAEAGTLKGWSFEVPKTVEGMPLSDKIAFYDLAKGMPFDQLTEEQRREVGPLLVRASLAMLFRYGTFDADRHKGNWLIDPETKTIYAIDFGQLEDFQPKGWFQEDPRLVLAEFLRAVQAHDVDGIIRQARLMTKPGSSVPSGGADLRQALSEEKVSDRLIGILTALTEAGFVIDRRYIFGAMKGLLILYGEGYVDESSFMRVMEGEVRSLYLKRHPFSLLRRLLS
ncbi:MAG: AarF/UbiB family protein [Elusimicrobiota bacterium]